MAEEFFYQYTSKKATKLIIFKGNIFPSLEAIRDAIFGEGVYLTTLEPGHEKETIKNNNWDGVAASKQRISRPDFWLRYRDLISRSLHDKTRPRLFSSESQYQDETEIFFPESQCRNRTETFFSGSLNVETRPSLFQSLNIATRQRLLYKT